MYSAKAPHGRAGGSGGRASCGEAPTNASSTHQIYPVLYRGTWSVTSSIRSSALATQSYLTRRQMSMASSEEQFGQILALLGKNSKGIQELRSSMTEIRALRTDINIWKPLVDNRVSELEHAVMDLGEHVEQALGSLLPQAQPVDLSVAAQAGTVTIAQPSPIAAHGEPSASTSMKVPGSAHLDSGAYPAGGGFWVY